MTLMEHIPQELLSCFALYCSRDDLVNLACCSRVCSSKFKPILWQFVKIHLFENFEPESDVLKNLQYTIRLHILSAKKYTRPQMVEKNEEFDRGILLSQVLSHCSASKVKGLILEDFTEFSFSYVIRTLRFVKHLRIVSNNHQKWQKWNFETAIDFLPPLDELQLPRIPDNQMSKVLEKLELQSLTVTIDRNAGDVPRLISAQKSLRKLRVTCIEGSKPVDLSPLGKLSSLSHLLLRGQFTEESFLHLCRNIPQLKVLQIGLSRVLDDDSFREIHHLTSLTHLCFSSHMTSFTTKVFKYIILMKSLQFLAVEDAFFRTERSGADVSDDVALLNRLPTLQEIIIPSCDIEDENSLPESISNVVFGLLKGRTSWKLKFSQEEMAYICIRVV